MPSFSDQIDALYDQYGGYELIPNDALYDLLQGGKQDLINMSKLGSDHIPNSNLGKEVRRRSIADLKWLAKYFLWDSMSVSNGGEVPISENIFLDPQYDIFAELFVKKDPTKSIQDQDPVKTRVLLWPRGGAKALDIDTLIPTPSGFRKMGDLEVGDEVYSETGKPVKVAATSPIFENHTCYEVEFSSGEKIVADEGHLWLTDARKDRDKAHRSVRGNPSPSVKTTKQISDSLFTGATKKEHNHRIVLAKPITGVEKELLIPPYVLGCWLGDGTSSAAAITCDNKDLEIIENIIAEGVPAHKAKRTESGKYLWYLNGGKEHPEFKKRYKGFQPALRKLGVFNNKHIPEEYLWASYEQRLALLQGLMDTDGTAAEEAGKCQFSNMNRHLSEQVKQLAASLGLRPWIAEREAVLEGRKVGTEHYVGFSAPYNFKVFRLTRKQNRITQRNTFDYRQIVAVRPVESRPVKCIMVDSPTHLYLVGEGFIPTHNSSYDHIDALQWIIAFPVLRILYQTAEATLSKGFTGELKGYFTLREDSPTLFNLFFPEHCCLPKDMGAGTLFTTPVYKAKKTGRKEPTVVASSVGKTKSGWHYEVIKSDDAVSDKNTETSEQCSTVSEKLFLSEKLLMPGGFYKDYVGTRYAEEDHYGILLDKYLTNGEIETTTGVGWTLTYNKTYAIKILIGKACQIKPEVEERLRREGKPVNYIEAGEDGCILLLPKKQPYSWLMGEYANNERVFEGQLNQNPRTASSVVFDLPSLLRVTVPYHMLPRQGPVSQFWDLSFSEKKGTDYCVGSSVMWGEEDVLDSVGKRTGARKTVGYVRKVIRDRFNPFSAAQAVVQLVVEERPFILGIEDAGGSKNLEPAIHAEAQKTGDPYVIAVCTHIDWVTPSNEKDAKKIRMGSLLPWIQEGRLKFANFAMQPKYPTLDALYKEFQACMSSHHHDDIPDNLGYQPRYAPRATQAIVENSTEMFFNIDRQGWSQLFDEECMAKNGSYMDENGNIVSAQPEPVVSDMFSPEPEVWSRTPHGMPNILGAGMFG